MKKMNNFELQEKSIELQDTFTASQLARMVIEAGVLLEEGISHSSKANSGKASGEFESKAESFLLYNKLK